MVETAVSPSAGPRESDFPIDAEFMADMRDQLGAVLTDFFDDRAYFERDRHEFIKFMYMDFHWITTKLSPGAECIARPDMYRRLTQLVLIKFVGEIERRYGEKDCVLSCTLCVSGEDHLLSDCSSDEGTKFGMYFCVNTVTNIWCDLLQETVNGLPFESIV